MRKGIVDRFEGEYAVIEFDGKTEDILKSELPDEVTAGDTLIFEDGKVAIDKEDTAQRKKEIDNLMDELLKTKTKPRDYSRGLLCSHIYNILYINPVPIILAGPYLMQRPFSFPFICRLFKMIF